MNFKEAYEICAKKAKWHMKNPEEVLYECMESQDGTYDKKGCHLSGYWNWLTSCAVGMAPIMAEAEKDAEALKFANSLAKAYEEKVSQYPAQAMHDIGFLYLPYSVHLYELTGDLGHRETALRAADALAKRFVFNGQFIEAWGSVTNPGELGRVIIDSMMNVTLLFWAWKETGYAQYYDMGVAHVETIIDTFVREDYSVCHSYIMDTTKKRPIEEANTCGFGNGSHWARGTAWMVYGLVSVYRYTRNEEYLSLAEKIGEKFIECLTEEDSIPVWDFRLPADKPAALCRNVGGAECEWDESCPENKKYNRDTSAAAIMSCAFMAFCSMRENIRFAEAADKMMTSLTDSYLNCDTTIPGMLRCSNGRNKYNIYGDYYYFAALAMKVYGIKGCW